MSKALQLAGVSEDDVDEFIVDVEKGDKEGKIRIFKEDGRWHERQTDGDELYGIGKNYMSYLKPSDIMSWLNRDFDHVEVVEINERNVDENYG